MFSLRPPKEGDPASNMRENARLPMRWAFIVAVTVAVCVALLFAGVGAGPIVLAACAAATAADQLIE